MFIDRALNPIIRAPAERNVSYLGWETDLCFAPLERGESFGGCRSINISLRWSESQPDCCTWKLNPPFSVCGLCVLCVSVVSVCLDPFTRGTEVSQREVKSRHYQNS